MSRKENPAIDAFEDDEMLPEYDLSKAVPGNTAYRLGEDDGDEAAIEQFWRGLGFEVERITEPDQRHSKAPDFLLRRAGAVVAVCEVKSMGDFDYTVRVLHQEGAPTETHRNWRDSNAERVLQRTGLAMDQLACWNNDRSLAQVFVLVNHDRQTHRESVQTALLALSGIDATFWFESDGGALDANPVVIASAEGQRRLKDQLGLALETRLSLTSAA
ncbi:MAG TPA: hypothetical protein VE291_11915 [Terracidiphilus sp.]|jgi:hypothetical protein|nr:hypothetical protein [Terracidiphilus sp.]